MELSYSEISTSIAAIAGNSTFEIRCLGIRKGQVDSGYFDTPSEAAAALCGSGSFYKGVYITPNAVAEPLKARSYNRIKPWAENTTLDPDITKRQWLLVDIDPKRPAGISSSDAEHMAALNQAETIASYLSLYGFPMPMINDSGNGAHLMYRIDEPNTPEVRDEIQGFLHILAHTFDTDTCEIDRTVFNAARIWRVPGTWAKKGDSTPDRPHRKSRTVQYADPFKVLDFITLLRFNAEFADAAKVPQQRTSPSVGTDEKLYRRLNEYAMRNLKTWVPAFFPDAREYKEGYRVSSADIGESYEEDLTIHPLPMGIKYFGIADQGDTSAGKRTPVGIIAEYALRTGKENAARKLSDCLNFPLVEFDALPITNHSVPMVAHNSISELMGTKRPFNFAAVKSVADLQKQAFNPIKWVVQDMLPSGNIMLAARPKMRKTWLALQLAMAIASGREFLGHQCNQGEVLFLALEDNERRIQNRIKTMQRFDMVPPDLSGFKYFTGGVSIAANGKEIITDIEAHEQMNTMFPKGDEGVDALEQYLEANPKTSCIIIDTLQHFRGERASRDIYDSDYKAMMPITRLASRKEILIVPVHHEKKGNADRGIGADFLEDVSGSAGITGGVDGVISIKGRRGIQEENESRKILISGRDIPYDYEFDVAFDAEQGGWINSKKEDAKVAILHILQQYPVLNQKELTLMLPNVSQARLSKALIELKLENKIDHGKYGYNVKRGHDV
jgi:hypothetical protein